MTSLLTDPIVLICTAVIIVGIFAFFWGVSKFRKFSNTITPEAPLDEALPITPLPEVNDFRPSPARPSVAPAATASTPAVSQEVADRLESMTQRLSEMQTVLMKQAGGGAPAAGGVGQGFSPETIDKLLKIVGNVIQQVDILQKSLNPPK